MKATSIIRKGSRAPISLGGSVNIASKEGAQMAGYVYSSRLSTPAVRKAGAIIGVGHLYDYIESRSSSESYQQSGGRGKAVFDTLTGLMAIASIANQIRSNKKKRKPCPPGHTWSDLHGRCVKKRYRVAEHDIFTGNPPTRFIPGRRT